MSLAAELALDIRSVFAPRPETTVTEWAEQNVFLPLSVTQNAGQYSTSHCAYIRELLEDFRNPAVSESANCFAAQVYKTTGVFVGIGYRIDQQPANVMMVLPTHGLAQSFSQTKWQPIIESSPVLFAHKQRDKDKFKNLEQQFDNSILYFIGSGSENSLKGRSVEILVIDEIDDVEEKWAKKGKSGVAMLESRVKSYAGSKVIKTGTPKEITGAIWKAFLEGDRRLYFVECPECKGKTCSKPFAIEFDPEYVKQWFPDVVTAKVVWDKSAKKSDGSYSFEKVRKTAALECPCCKSLLPQERLPAMVANGRWIATNPNSISGKISRRLPSMYSPHEACTLGNLAVKFLQSQSSPGGLRNFLNEELAVPHQQKGFTTTENDIRAIVSHSPEYLRGTIPKEDIALLSLTVDVNADVLHWIIRAWFADSSSALVDYGNLLPNWPALVEVSQRKYTVGAKELSPMFCLIDSGWRTKGDAGVYDFCIRTGNRFVPVKGATKTQGLTKTVEETDQEFKGQHFKLVRFDDNALRHDLYFNKIRKREGSNWFLPRNIGTDYEEQLTDEYLKQEKGQAKWDTRNGNNHLGDCEKYQLIIPTLIESVVGKDGLRKLADRIKGKLT